MTKAKRMERQMTKIFEGDFLASKKYEMRKRVKDLSDDLIAVCAKSAVNIWLAKLRNLSPDNPDFQKLRDEAYWKTENALWVSRWFPWSLSAWKRLSDEEKYLVWKLKYKTKYGVNLEDTSEGARIKEWYLRDTT